MVGTPEYMSPEQAGVIQMDVDTRTDVYALGVVLYELLCGARPYTFTRQTAAEILRILSGPPPRRPSAVSGRGGPPPPGAARPTACGGSSRATSTTSC